MYLGHIGLATQHQTYLWTCGCWKINSDGKVQLGSGSGHFALNAEPEPGIRFRFGSAFERVRTQQSSGILVGMKLVKENTNRCLLSFSRLYEFFEITSTRFDGLQAKLFHQRFGSMSERDSAVNVEPDVQCRFKTRLDLEPKHGVQFLLFSYESHLIYDITDSYDSTFSAVERHFTLYDISPISTLLERLVESELGYNRAENILALSEILKGLDRGIQGLHHNIRLIARQGKLAFGAIWCILGFLEGAEMHNKEEKHRMCISTLHQRVGQSSAGDAIMLEGRIM
ncbi:hypothetical protein B0H13DRAFT_1865612 [Mycena leptocephala]|nr:hypothetical protein B0H13DRAFT_1865612 [Mycena leptocephala]